MNLKNKMTAVRNILLVVLAAGFVFSACKKDEELSGPDRLFRPNLKGSLKANANWIQAGWESIKGADSYTVELSRDTFKTIDRSVTVDTNVVLVENLKWNQLYQVQVKANASDPTKDSKMGSLGEIKTPKFPSILKAIESSDIQDISVRVRWTNSGTAVSKLKVYLLSDSSFVKDVELTQEDVTKQEKIVSLTPDTKYIIYLYSGETLRGWDNYTTKAALTGDIVDLRAVNGDPLILFNTLSSPDFKAGSTILLARGTNYTIPSSFVFTKSVKIMTGSGYEGSPATITLNANFDANGSINYLRFEDLIIAQAGASYFMNVSNVAKIDEVSFESCKTIGTFANSFIRLKTAGDVITKLIMNNCIIGDFGISGSYAVVQAGASNSAKVDQIEITNSTFYKIYSLVRQDGVTAASLKIDNCTFNEFGKGTINFINYSAGNPANFTVSNTIFGKTIDATSKWINAGKGLPAVTNTYYSSDCVFGSDKIAGTSGTSAYASASTVLFEDPASFNFKIKDAGFAGKATAGDPRWR